MHAAAAAASNRYINDNARPGQSGHTQTGRQAGREECVRRGHSAAKRLKMLLSTWHKNAVPNPQQEPKPELSA